MALRMTFYTDNPLSEQKDVRSVLNVPMVYENVPVEPARWEYRVLTVDTREEDLPGEAQLNELGNQGWVLVGMLNPGESRFVHYYFVRQKSE